MRILLTILVAVCASSPSWAARSPATYDYPITDAYDATVIGTPVAFRAKLPEKIPAKQYRLPSHDGIPEIFWYNDELRFSAALQKHAAPLVFNIAGTGAGHDSAKMVLLQKALYESGFHVINIGSPTELNFQLAASTSHTPGYTPDDVADIYRVLQQAYRHVKDQKPFAATAFHVAGYSLGAMHAAFVAELDQREKKLGIQKVFMINPPVNLYNSALIFDRMLVNNLPRVNGIPNPGPFLDNVIEGLAHSYQPAEGITFNGDFVYTAYEQQKKDGVFATDATAEGLIAFSFRLTSSAMVFTSDVMTRAGYIVPKDKVFTTSESLAPYARRSYLVSFHDYIEDLLIPSVQARHPGKTREQIIEGASLRSIEGFLRSNPQVRVVTNRDEIILADGELAYLEQVMGDRMTIYPTGGHCGNMGYTTNVDDMVAFLRTEDGQ